MTANLLRFSFAGLLLAAGVVGLFRPSYQILASGAVVLVAHIFMVVGGLLALCGLFRKCWPLELLGWPLVGSGALTIALASVTGYGDKHPTVFLELLALVVCITHRWYTVRTDIKRFRRLNKVMGGTPK
ncbi:hypothetical protein O1L55_20780 [Streptomyces albulus]|nr:hypothetical protein [Streptomyces noursei]